MDVNTILEYELTGDHDQRDQLLDWLTNQDLSYQLPGQNPTFGGLFEEMGCIQQVYTQSFSTLKMDWGYCDLKPESTTSVAHLKAWFEKLDAEMVETVRGLSEEEVQNRQIDRGHGFTPSPFVQIQVYHEALLIFFAKASVYLKALDKQVTDQWKSGIG
jgi:hypothetical protein